MRRIRIFLSVLNSMKSACGEKWWEIKFHFLGGELEYTHHCGVTIVIFYVIDSKSDKVFWKISNNKIFDAFITLYWTCKNSKTISVTSYYICTTGTAWCACGDNVTLGYFEQNVWLNIGGCITKCCKALCVEIPVSLNMGNIREIGCLPHWIANCINGNDTSGLDRRVHVTVVVVTL